MRLTFFKRPSKTNLQSTQFLRSNSFRLFFFQQKSAQDPLLLSTLGPAMLTMMLFTAWGAGTGRFGHPARDLGNHQPAHVLPHRIHVWYISLHLVDFYGKCREIYHTWILWVHDSCCRSGAALRHCPTKHRGTSRSDLWLLRVTWRLR